MDQEETERKYVTEAISSGYSGRRASSSVARRRRSSILASLHATTEALEAAPSLQPSQLLRLAGPSQSIWAPGRRVSRASGGSLAQPVPTRRRVGREILVPVANPNLLKEEAIDLARKARHQEREQFPVLYLRKRRIKSREKSMLKMSQMDTTHQLYTTLLATTRNMQGTSVPYEDTVILDDLIKAAMGQEQLASNLLPQSLVGAKPATISAYEEELLKRIKQANPAEDEWSKVWPRTLQCDRCLEFCSGVEGGCNICDAVTHMKCMDEEQLSLQKENQFKCDACAIFVKENNELFEFWKAKLLRLRLEKESAAKIVHFIKCNFYRRRFMKFRRACSVIQSSIRRFLFWRRILTSRRRMVRPVIIRVLSVQALVSPYSPESPLANPYVVVTVFKPDQSQRFKCKTQPLKNTTSGKFEEEEFLVPGTTANVMVGLTVLHRKKSEDSFVSDVFLGQAIFSLQRVLTFSRNHHTLTLRLGDIEFVPKETPYSEMPMDAVSFYKPGGSVTIGLFYFNSIFGLCTHVAGPSLDVWRRKSQHVSALYGTQQVTSLKRISWYLVLADGRLYVYKKEGQTEPKVVLEGSELQGMTRSDANSCITLHLVDKTVIPMNFEMLNVLKEWWFALVVLMAQERGISLTKFVYKLCTRPEYWQPQTHITASQMIATAGRLSCLDAAASSSSSNLPFNTTTRRVSLTLTDSRMIGQATTRRPSLVKLTSSHVT